MIKYSNHKCISNGKFPVWGINVTLYHTFILGLKSGGVLQWSGFSVENNIALGFYVHNESPKVIWPKFLLDSNLL